MDPDPDPWSKFRIRQNDVDPDPQDCFQPVPPPPGNFHIAEIWMSWPSWGLASLIKLTCCQDLQPVEEVMTLLDPDLGKRLLGFEVGGGHQQRLPGAPQPETRGQAGRYF